MFYACADMPKPSKTLVEIKDECRRFADEIGNKAVALILHRAAYDLEMHMQREERFSKLHLRLAATNGQLVGLSSLPDQI